MPSNHHADPQSEPTPLSRSLNLPLLVLYGLGTTVGAGIYALLSDIAGTAGWLAPWAFLLASTLAALSALSFAELSSRFPQAGATALFIEKGFRQRHFASGIGLLLVLSAMLSAAALVNAMVGYAQVFTPVSREFIITLTVASVCAVSLWGITQSAWIAGAISLLEIGGVIWMTVLAGRCIDEGSIEWARITPNRENLDLIFAGSVLSFYAYIGFEDMVEVAEEVKDVRRTLPLAILITLGITSVLYVGLMLATQLAVGIEFLSNSNAPFADIYQELTGTEPVAFMSIGLLAIVNGVLIQIVMASRVLYGLANRRALPASLAYVSPTTQTPTTATLLVAVGVLALALLGTLGGLAKSTALIMLTIFGLANLSLFIIKGRTPSQSINPDYFHVPRIVPLLGALTCLAFVTRSLLA